MAVERQYDRAIAAGSGRAGSTSLIKGTPAFVAGGALLVGGAELLVRGESRRRATASVRAEYEEAFGDDPIRETRRGWPLNVALIAIGLAMLVLGSRWLVSASVGTSLPEVATSVIAAIRGERDIAVGNVVGSNIFNLLIVLGLGSVVAPAGIRSHLGGYRIERWEGLLFLAYYIACVVYLILTATAHAAVPAFRTAMLYFALPLTAVTLAVVAARAALRPPPSGVRRPGAERPE